MSSRRRKRRTPSPTPARVQELSALPSLSVDEAAELAGCVPRTLGLWYARGCPRPGVGRRIPTRPFLDWLGALTAPERAYEKAARQAADDEREA